MWYTGVSHARCIPALSVSHIHNRFLEPGQIRITGCSAWPSGHIDRNEDPFFSGWSRLFVVQLFPCIFLYHFFLDVVLKTYTMQGVPSSAKLMRFSIEKQHQALHRIQADNVLTGLHHKKLFSKLGCPSRSKMSLLPGQLLATLPRQSPGHILRSGEVRGWPCLS